MGIKSLWNRWLSPLIPLFPLPVTEGDIYPLLTVETSGHRVQAHRPLRVSARNIAA